MVVHHIKGYNPSNASKATQEFLKGWEVEYSAEAVLNTGLNLTEIFIGWSQMKG